MSKQELTLASGAKIEIYFAGMEKAFDLKDSIQEELLKVNIDLNKDINISEMDIMVFKDLYFKIDSSKLVRKCVFDCMQDCLYNGFKITKDTFSTRETLGDYYEVAMGVIMFNLSPFFGNLGQKFQTFLTMTQLNQK